jgi:hypothetical protein
MRYEPPPPSRAALWLRAALIPLAILGGLVGAALVMTALTPPTPNAGPPTTVAFASPASPFTIAFPDRWIIVTETPGATAAPSATYVMATETPPLICGPWVDRNAVCQMPEIPHTPTPSPPDCPTTPGDECIWRGGATAATPLVPTPYEGSP